MILAYHSIVSAYGFWLPNDPRGSWSDFVRSWELLRYGGPTKVDTPRSLADRPHCVERRLQAKNALRYPAVQFTGVQARTVGEGFAQAVDEGRYRVWACAILPEHAHLIVAPAGRRVEKVVGHLKARATQRLNEVGLHPLARFRDAKGRVPSPWGRKSWNVFIDSARYLEAAIQYVMDNPGREGRPRQNWSFVRPPRL